MAAGISTPAPARAQIKSGIYEIVNILNGKRYVGSAVDLVLRWRVHRAGLNASRHSNRHLQASWKKHGEEAFAFAVLEVCELGELIVREQSAIERIKPEFNICPTAGSTLGRRHSEETRRKIAARKIGLKLPPRSAEYLAKVSARHKGKILAPDHMAAFQEGRRRQVFDDERRLSISEDLKASYVDGRRSRERPPEYREKIAAALRGRKATAEHRANQSAAQRGKKRARPYNLDPAKAEARKEAGRRLAERHNGRPMLPHVAAALLAANKGRKHSDERRQKMSEIRLKLWTPERKAKQAAALRAYHARRRKAKQEITDEAPRLFAADHQSNR